MMCRGVAGNAQNSMMQHAINNAKFCPNFVVKYGKFHGERVYIVAKYAKIVEKRALPATPLHLCNLESDFLYSLYV